MDCIKFAETKKGEVRKTARKAYEKIFAGTEKGAVRKTARRAYEELTLDNIFTNTPEEELSAIVHSIMGRINERLTESYYEGESDIKKIPLTDKEVHKIVVGLRKAA